MNHAAVSAAPQTTASNIVVFIFIFIFIFIVVPSLSPFRIK
jgi:hypothetical protein